MFTQQTIVSLKKLMLFTRHTKLLLLKELQQQLLPYNVLAISFNTARKETHPGTARGIHFDDLFSTWLIIMKGFVNTRDEIPTPTPATYVS